MDINEIMNRAKAAQAQALESLHKAEEKAKLWPHPFLLNRMPRRRTTPHWKRNNRQPMPGGRWKFWGRCLTPRLWLRWRRTRNSCS